MTLTPGKVFAGTASLVAGWRSVVTFGSRSGHARPRGSPADGRFAPRNRLAYAVRTERPPVMPPCPSNTRRLEPNAPRVALLIESSNAYGRGLLAGVEEYIRDHEPWSVY